MINKNILNLKYKLLRDKSHRFRKENIIKLQSHGELIRAFNKKYSILFDIINTKGIQYKQFLSAFFNCILTGHYEPFSIRIKKKEYNLKSKKEKLYEIYVLNQYTANYNYLTLAPWDKYNIVKCYNINKYAECTEQSLCKMRINKEQFMQALIVLFPRFIKKFPRILLDLNEKLKNTKSNTISVNHLYKYLVYCGDKLAKEDISRGLKNKHFYKFNKDKINNFLKIFTLEQLITILNS